MRRSWCSRTGSRWSPSGCSMLTSATAPSGSMRCCCATATPPAPACRPGPPSQPGCTRSRSTPSTGRWPTLSDSARSRSSTGSPAASGSPTGTGSAHPAPAVTAQLQLLVRLPVRGVAAQVWLPVRMRPGVAAAIGAGWPHQSGMTESLLPIHHHPLLPHPAIRATNTHGDEIRGWWLALVAESFAVAPSGATPGANDTTNCCATAACTPNRPGMTTSTRCAQHAPEQTGR